MKIPPWVPSNMSEEEALAIIEKVARTLSPSFAFPPHEVDDIMQVARIEAILLLGRGKYDGERPLEGYLMTGVRRRLLNHRRDNYRRNDPPCRPCHDGSPCTSGERCPEYEKWANRQQDRARVRRPVCIDSVAEESKGLAEAHVFEDVALRELMERVDERLPAEMRADWLRLRDGVSVPLPRRQQVEAAVRAILGDAVE